MFSNPSPNHTHLCVNYQVIGVIYRNTPYIIQNESYGASVIFLDFVINMLGFAMPFPVCFYKNVSAFATAFLGFFPPIIAALTAIVYSWA